MFWRRTYQMGISSPGFRSATGISYSLRYDDVGKGKSIFQIEDACTRKNTLVALKEGGVAS